MKNLLATHALKTLPDSTAQRRALLQEVIRVTPKNSETRITATYLLRLLTQQDRAQKEFAFKCDGGIQ